MRDLKPFCFFSFSLAFEKTFIFTYINKSRCYRTGKYTVCRRVRATFCPEILEAAAVKGLKQRDVRITLYKPVSRCTYTDHSAHNYCGTSSGHVSVCAKITVFLENSTEVSWCGLVVRH